MLFGFIFIVFGIGSKYRFKKGFSILGFKEGILRLFKFGLIYF